MSTTAIEPDTENDYLTLSRDPLVSLTLALPLLVFYQAGLVVLLLLGLNEINGVDLLTRLVLPRWGLKGMVVLDLSVIALFLIAVIRLENRGRRFRWRLFFPLLIESGVYAGALGSVIVFILDRIYAFSIGSAVRERFAQLTLSLGAGFHEELVFRLVLIGVLGFVLVDFIGLGERTGLLLAVLLSSLLFAAAHHLGSLGDPWRLDVFLFRFLAGLLFAAIYKLRSFATAAWTHALYDVYVLVF